MTASKIAPFIKHNSKPQNITDCLIYEIMDEKSVYFKEYEEVVFGKSKSRKLLEVICYGVIF
jgi:hypothetical protein